jgi:hypothetical protein
LEEIMNADNAKCAHPNCSCPTDDGKYCSVECEAMAKTPDIACTCGHGECAGNTQSRTASAAN